MWKGQKPSESVSLFMRFRSPVLQANEGKQALESSRVTMQQLLFLSLATVGLLTAHEEERRGAKWTTASI